MQLDPDLEIRSPHLPLNLLLDKLTPKGFDLDTRPFLGNVFGQLKTFGTKFIQLGQDSKGMGLETVPSIETLPSLNLWTDFHVKTVILIPYGIVHLEPRIWVHASGWSSNKSLQVLKNLCMTKTGEVGFCIYSDLKYTFCENTKKISPVAFVHSLGLLTATTSAIQFFRSKSS